jgi:glucosamine--fructose-6-phosphate aminotransferase (isomerizing)
VLILGARGATERETRSLATAMRSRGARVYAITDDETLAAKVDDAVLLRRAVGELLSPIVLVVAAQHVAAHVARRHGRDPEKPAGLSKVTRTL